MRVYVPERFFCVVFIFRLDEIVSIFGRLFPIFNLGREVYISYRRSLPSLRNLVDANLRESLNDFLKLICLINVG